MTPLGERAWPELAGRPTVLVPVGSVEKHGPHLPLDTDARVAVASRAAGGTDLLVAPAVAYGASGEHEGFAGTVSIGHEALQLVLVELGRSAARWAGRLVFVNGHGGNVATLVQAVGLLRHKGRAAAWYACAAEGDAHSGRAETSLVLALEPGLVRPDRPAGNPAPLVALLPTLRAGGVAAVSPNGVLGDATGASATEGARLLAAMAAEQTAAVACWTPDPIGRLH